MQRTSPDPRPADFKSDNGHECPTHVLLTSGRWIRTPKNYHKRADTLISHKFYKGEWYETPSLEELENWLYDGVCETPDGDAVEPDHPRGWIRLIGLI